MSLIDSIKAKFSQPLSNDGLITHEEGQPRTNTQKDIFDRVKITPEVVAPAKAIVDDVLGQGYVLDYTGRSDTSGQNVINKAEKFIDYQLLPALDDVLFDKYFVGDMYLFKKKHTRRQIKAFVDNSLNGREFNYKASRQFAQKRITDELVQKAKDEDMMTTKDVRPIPAMTVRHDTDKYGDINKFVQRVGGDKAELDPTQVLHLSDMHLNGKTYGFSPLQTIFSEIDILANIKDTHGVFFDNAAVADKAWVLPNADPGSKSYKLLKKTVKKYRKLANKHKDMVLTGEVDVENLNQLDDVMEFKELAEYISRVVMMTWGVPPTRVGITVSGENPSRSASLTTEGYFRKIKREQSKLEALLNAELLDPEWNVRIKFKNPDIRSQIREADRDLRKTEVAQKRLSLGLWTPDKAKEYLDIRRYEFPSKYVNDEDVMDRAEMLTSSKNSLLPDKTINRDNAEEAEAVEKKLSEEGQ